MQVVQQLFEHGTQIQKTMLANTIASHILTLSLQMYGSRVVQKVFLMCSTYLVQLIHCQAIEYILPEQQARFIKELDNHVMKCVKDLCDNHVSFGVIVSMTCIILNCR